MHLVGFSIRIYHDARSPERQIQKLLVSYVDSHIGYRNSLVMSLTSRRVNFDKKSTANTAIFSLCLVPHMNEAVFKIQLIRVVACLCSNKLYINVAFNYACN